MASSGRTRRSNTVSRPSRGPTLLPPYQPPANKLNDAAQRALHNLPNTHRLDGLHHRLKHASDLLCNNAGELNDRYQQKAAGHQKRQARRRAQGAADDDDDDSNVEKMKHDVKEMTGRMEQSMRMIIDAKAAVDGVEGALKELDANIMAGRGAVAPTQSTLGASQFRQKGRKRGVESDDEESEQSEDEVPASQALGDGPTIWWRRKAAENSDTYEGLSMHNRYALNNDYIGFRKVIHDARHPEDDAPPMPNASTWFPDSQDTLEGDADGADGQAAAENDDDEDIAIASERKSLKCPITLLTMVDPLSSTKCPHSFERSAILGMLKLSEVRIGGSGRHGERAMKCPECNVMLTASDLQNDPVLVRRIKRLQAAEAMEEGDSEEDVDIPSLPRGTQTRQAEPISSDNEGGYPTNAAARARSAIPKIKAEKLASSIRDREVSMVPNSQVQTLAQEDERPPSTAASEIVDLEDVDADEEEE